ncbi:MAG: DEAD/DEAH box helicase, partial [Alphaproteobacteria bacterium]
MRPEILHPLFADISTLQGIGPKAKSLLAKLGIETPRDLLWHLPSGAVDRRFSPTIADAPDGEIVTLDIMIDAHDAPPPRSRRPFRVKAHDDSGEMEIIFFHARADWVANQLPIGTRRFISGRAERFRGALQMAHPDHMVPPTQADMIMRLEPTYPLTQGLSGKMLDKAMRQALPLMPKLPEWQDESVLGKFGWPAFDDAVRACHQLEDAKSLEPQAPMRQRLAYDELLASQLALQIVRARARAGNGQANVGDKKLVERLRQSLPYHLTGSQDDAIAAILSDMADPKRMMRLLQGDVGSGKTIVALMAMVAAAGAGGQAALMAPTEILARQHLETIVPLIEPLGLKVDILTGRDKGETRAAKLAALADGSLHLIIGTHALFQADVAFHNLRLAVVDEQHRFGVHQRLLLQDKGKDGTGAAAADVLVMTATPIPRTLTLTAY